MAFTSNEDEYLSLLRLVRNEGQSREDRTGVGTLSVFGEQLRFLLEDGFPLITTKHVSFKNIAVELLWFLQGDTSTEYLVQHGVHIWDANATPLRGTDQVGHVGPIYGKQWRSWSDPHTGLLIDQITEAIRLLRTEPTSRRILVSAWNVADLPYMVLPPCHYAFQFYVSRGTYLECLVSMRSVDLFLGFPYNLASYALLTAMVAQVTGHTPGRLIFNLGDAHIYWNHLAQVDEQLTREPLTPPRLWLNPDVREIDDFHLEDFQLTGRRQHPALPAPLAV